MLLRRSRKGNPHRYCPYCVKVLVFGTLKIHLLAVRKIIIKLLIDELTLTYVPVTVTYYSASF